MPVEFLTYLYKSQVEDQADTLCRELGVRMGEQVVRFPVDPWEYAGEARDILIVDGARVNGLGAAIAYRARDYFSVNLMKRLGFISGKEAINELMQDVDGNLVVSFDHGDLPYRAQALIQNMGCCEYLLGGFVISPK